MGSILVTAAVAVAAVVLAVATVLGLVALQSSPPQVSKPLVSYGTR